MLLEKVFVFNPASLGGGSYTIDLFFSNPAKAKYLAIGDQVQDTNTNRYQITSATFPYQDGTTVTFSFVDNDVIPLLDSGFDSVAFTPGQADLRPAMRTAGSAGSFIIFDSTNYEYEGLFSPTISVEANKAVVGDSIVDSNGKEFVITFIDGASRFNINIRMQERDKVGEFPSGGDGTLYRSSTNRNFFQGTEITDPARTNIFNRDKVIIDLNLGSGGGGGEANTSSNVGGENEVFKQKTSLDFEFRTLKAGTNIILTQNTSDIEISSTASGGGPFQKSMVNNTGVSIAANSTVAKKSDGSIVLADSDAAGSQQYVGVTLALILNGAAGIVQMPWPNLAGALTALGFSSGDDVFMGETPGTFIKGADFTGGDDQFTKVGVADCATGIASATATDLIMFTEVLGGP